MMRFLLTAFGAGFAAVIVSMVVLQALASDPSGDAATLREDDLVSLMVAAFAAGVAIFSFWSARARTTWLIRSRTRFAAMSVVLTLASSFAAFTFFGFVIERRFTDSLQSPSRLSVVPALLLAVAIATWQRRTRPS